MDTKQLTIRQEGFDDHEAVEFLTFRSFVDLDIPGMPKRKIPTEHYLVSLLRKDPDFIPELDFVAVYNNEIISSIFYSRSKVIRPNGAIVETVTFGPVAVKPEFQGWGIGSALIQHSLKKARELGYKALLIMGHEAYYPRFGFVPASRFGITLEDGSSPAALMALELSEGALGTTGGKWLYADAYTQSEDQKALEAYHERFLKKFEKQLKGEKND